jgi:hypothetical protein
MMHYAQQEGDHLKNDESDWRLRIQTLERSLEQELKARSVLDRELYEIKNSLAWTLVVKLRRFRNRLFPRGTRLGGAYELVRDFSKALVLHPRETPQLACRGIRFFSRGGISELRRHLRNQIEARSLDHDYAE